MGVERIEVAGGVRLAVSRQEGVDPGGRHPPFLLVHGLASNARLWDEVAESLASRGHPVAAVDLRGHGQSDKPDDGYDFATIADDLRVLIRALELRRPIVAGQSWGAGVVVEMAARYPELASGVVCVDGGINELAVRFPDWEECARWLAPPRLEGRSAGEVETVIRSHHPDWSDAAVRATLANFEVRPDGTVAPWLTYERHMRILRAMWEHHAFDSWSRLQAPALVCPADSGDPAWSAEKRASLERVRLLHSRTRVRWFVGDHDIHAQHPLELADVMRAAVTDGFFG